MGAPHEPGWPIKGGLDLTSLKKKKKKPQLGDKEKTWNKAIWHGRKEDSHFSCMKTENTA